MAEVTVLSLLTMHGPGFEGLVGVSTTAPRSPRLLMTWKGMSEPCLPTGMKPSASMMGGWGSGDFLGSCLAASASSRCRSRYARRGRNRSGWDRAYWKRYCWAYPAQGLNRRRA